MKTALTFVLVLAACGSKAKPEAVQPEHHAEMKGEHGGMPPEIAKFHDTLAPHWHAEKGPQRMKDTCTAIPTFQADADALAKATPPPGTDATIWANGTKELTDAVGALAVTCKGNDAAAFEPAFERVHKGFHGLMATAGGHHEQMEHEGEHDEHDEHDEHAGHM